MCSRWRDACLDTSFKLRILSVESGATEAIKSGTLTLDKNTYTNINDALLRALPGDTLSLCVGHHWECGLLPTVPIRLISGNIYNVLIYYFSCM